jgi:hypothetical protein
MATVQDSDGKYKSSSNKNFRVLAGYIFGGNAKKESIAMTAPVHMEFGDNGSKMSFVMPKKYNDKALPTPNDPQIEIKQSTPEYVAVISFGGYASDEKIKEHYEQLSALLKERKIEEKGGYNFLGYNAPFQFIGRTNEVIIPIEWKE